MYALPSVFGAGNELRRKLGKELYTQLLPHGHETSQQISKMHDYSGSQCLIQTTWA